MRRCGCGELVPSQAIHTHGAETKKRSLAMFAGGFPSTRRPLEQDERLAATAGFVITTNSTRPPLPVLVGPQSGCRPARSIQWVEGGQVTVQSPLRR